MRDGIFLEKKIAEVFLSLAMELDRARHGEICPRFSDSESCLATSGEMSSLGLENSVHL